jgi:hypothetical protein
MNISCEAGSMRNLGARRRLASGSWQERGLFRAVNAASSARTDRDGIQPIHGPRKELESSHKNEFRASFARSSPSTGRRKSKCIPF